MKKGNFFTGSIFSFYVPGTAGSNTRFVLLLAFSLLCLSCNMDKSKYQRTHAIGNDLYIEYYRVGILGNLTSNYFTDSSNFRIYLGTFDDESEYISTTVSGDKVMVEKAIHNKIYSSPDSLKVAELKVFSLKELKNGHTYE